jgi:hypothetical protein
VPHRTNRRGLSRTISVLLLIGAGACQPAAQPRGPSLVTPGTTGRGVRYVDAVAAVITALDSAPIVAVADLHGSKELGDFRMRLLRSKQLPDHVNDVVIEAGNSLYQSIADRYVNGDPVPFDSVRLIWNNTTQSPFNTLDDPLYAEDILRVVREVNATLSRDRRLRVLLSDPPIDWDRVQSRGDIAPFMSQRRESHVRVLADSVLAKGRRAVFFCGGVHLMRTTTLGDATPARATTTQRVLAKAPGSMLVVLIFNGFGGTASRYEPWIDELPRESFVWTRGTFLEPLLAEDVFSATPGMPAGASPAVVSGNGPSVYAGLRLSDVADAYIYLRPFRELTVSVPDLTRYRTNPALVAELDRRQRIRNGVPFDTAAFFAPPASRLLFGPWRGDMNIRSPAPPR